MVTDRPPRGRRDREEFADSNRILDLPLPSDSRLRDTGRAIETAIAAADRKAVKAACDEFLRVAAGFYAVPVPGLRVLAARPLRVRESGWATELFGDYNLETQVIRVWMRTAVQKRVTSCGTFLSTLCHEFCHHLDIEWFHYHGSPHTRGFYERAAALYHHTRATPRKELVWARLGASQWRIDWPRTNRGAPKC